MMPYRTLYPSIDPDFDAMGNDITVKELINLESQVYERPYDIYLAHARAKRRADHQFKPRAPKKPKPEEQARFELHMMRQRFEQAAYRFAVFRRNLNRQCNHCIPYNGSFTPNYWGTNQHDPW